MQTQPSSECTKAHLGDRFCCQSTAAAHPQVHGVHMSSRAATAATCLQQSSGAGLGLPVSGSFTARGSTPLQG